MYYSINNAADYDMMQLVKKIEEESGKQAAVHFCNCMMLICNKAEHSNYLNELNSKLWFTRIAVEHDGIPTLFCDSLSSGIFYIYTIKSSQVKREIKRI
ncbi:hypothetical protein [Lactobacillus sp. ESL0225]|uniref:hypothetical protein n=1 Tax=Lactobacillus sp. ESL0225 TaxID=2069351 RepID=UPI000EFAA916|nr:hypothetical protein [Lactobacillus sp. ESL0225]MCT6890826.1 hypothetical protein [Lactobacillus sp.]RMC51310.1 hypothetical protein F5ESL0225_02885 [Lactobacillus sp. ESL0225]